MPERVVVDASAMVDLLVGTPLAEVVDARLRDHELHAPAHFDAEVLSALGRLHRDRRLTARQTASRVERLAAAPLHRHALPPLVVGAWQRRHNLRLVDALYAELADRLEVALITTDRRLAATYAPAELLDR
jgi:predicted nucleic acid-binding protein